MKPRALLLNPPGRRLIRDLYCSFTSRADYLWPPIDLLVLSGWLKRDFAVHVLDAAAEELSPTAAFERALAVRPEVVIALTGSASWHSDAGFLESLKQALGCRLLVTGDLSVDPELWLLKRFPWIDALIRDFTSPEILRYLGSKDPQHRYGDLAYRSNGAVISLGAPSQRPAAYAHPVPLHEKFPLERYRLPHAPGRRFTSILTGFGCPFACGFCIQSRLVMRFRSRDIANVSEELDQLARLGVRELFFRDPLFEARREHAFEVCRLLASHDFRWSCNSRVDTLDEELVMAMKEAGCRLVAVGIETADKDLARSVDKYIPVEKTLAAVRTCHKHGIQVAGYFLLGLPGETKESAEKTIRLAASSGVDFASFTVAAPDYGTPLRRRAIEEGRIQSAARDFDSGRRITLADDGLSPRELKSAYRRAYLNFYFRPSYLWRTLRQLRSLSEIQSVTRTALSILRNAAVQAGP